MATEVAMSTNSWAHQAAKCIGQSEVQSDLSSHMSLWEPRSVRLVVSLELASTTVATDANSLTLLGCNEELILLL